MVSIGAWQRSAETNRTLHGRFPSDERVATSNDIPDTLPVWWPHVLSINKDDQDGSSVLASGVANCECPAETDRASIYRQPEMDMNDSSAEESRLDLTQGVLTDSLADGKMLVGRVGQDAVLLANSGGEYFAIGTECT